MSAVTSILHLFVAHWCIFNPDCYDEKLICCCNSSPTASFSWEISCIIHHRAWLYKHELCVIQPNSSSCIPTSSVALWCFNSTFYLVNLDRFCRSVFLFLLMLILSKFETRGECCIQLSISLTIYRCLSTNILDFMRRSWSIIFMYELINNRLPTVRHFYKQLIIIWRKI